MADRFTKTFTAGADADDWAAQTAAENWCNAMGLSLGPNDRTHKRGVLLGNFHIAKYHNLTVRERSRLHGVLYGDSRREPLTIMLVDPLAISTVRAKESRHVA